MSSFYTSFQRNVSNYQINAVKKQRKEENNLNNNNINNNVSCNNNSNIIDKGKNELSN